MITEKEFADAIHMEIHAIRRLSKYSPTIMESNISRLVIEHFSDKCKECKTIGELNKNAPPKSEGFIKRIGKIISEGED
jgi:hypothetical protein